MSTDFLFSLKNRGTDVEGWEFKAEVTGELYMESSLCARTEV